MSILDWFGSETRIVQLLNDSLLCLPHSLIDKIIMNYWYRPNPNLHTNENEIDVQPLRLLKKKNNCNGNSPMFKPAIRVSHNYLESTSNFFPNIMNAMMNSIRVDGKHVHSFLEDDVGKFGYHDAIGAQSGPFVILWVHPSGYYCATENFRSIRYNLGTHKTDIVREKNQEQRFQYIYSRSFIDECEKWNKMELNNQLNLQQQLQEQIEKETVGKYFGLFKFGEYNISPNARHLTYLYGGINNIDIPTKYEIDNYPYKFNQKFLQNLYFKLGMGWSPHPGIPKFFE